MGIDVLGPLTIEGDQNALGRRDRVVIAALAVHPGEVVSAGQLADALWGERPPQSWQKVVQGCVVRLRKVLGAHSIETLPLGYRLVVPLDQIDAQRFDRAVARARELLASGEPERSSAVLAEALTLWRGRPLTELDGWDDARIEASRLTELRQSADELYVESALRSGHHDRVLGKAKALVAEEPLRERRWVLLATAQYRAGRQGEALQTIRRLRTVLDRDHGLDASSDVDALERAILRQEPSLVATSAQPDPSPVCPYPGLKPYDVDDADTFFGRDSDIAACLRKLSDTSVLVVAGPSGSGKSSLVRAGVAATLRRDGEQVVVLTPGPYPIAALATAMPGTTVPVLIVDQFEELFSLCHNVADRENFLAALMAHQAPLVISIRADRLADVPDYPAFSRLVERGLYLLSGMRADDLRAAIEEPARLSWLVAEPGLVDLLVNEVTDQPGALPLMAHALRETWQRREGRTLTVAGYNASGGIQRAVARSADEVYDQIPAEQRPILRDLLLRLVAPGPQGEPIPSRLPRRLLVTCPEDDTMINLLVASRLLTSDAGVVGIAHESLARAWPRLRGWLEDDLEGQRILHHLAVAADSWNNLDRPESELYRGVRLAKAVDWRERATPTLTATEADFLAAGTRLSDRELHAAETRARLQLRVNRRLRAALATGAVLLAGALIAGLAAVRQADHAEQAATHELARKVGGQAFLPEEISASLLLAAQGVRLDDAPETRANLVAAIGKHPMLVRSTAAPFGRTGNLDISPDGARLVSGDNRATFHLYDAKSGKVLHSYRFATVAENAEVFTTPRFSPDGRLIAVISGEHDGTAIDSAWPIRLLNADTLKPVEVQPASPKIALRLKNLTFSADGRYLVVGAQTAEGEWGAIPGFALVWDVNALGQQPRRVELGIGPQRAVISPDGRTLYKPWPFTAIDVATGKQSWQRSDLVGGPIVDSTIGLPIIEVSKDSRWIAYLHPGPARNNRTLTTVVNARTGQTVSVLRSPADPPRAAAFSADGKLLATAHFGGEVVVWEVATGRALHRLRTVEVSWAVAFSPDMRTLYTAGDRGLLRTYDLGGRQRYLAWTQAAPPRHYLHILPSGNRRRTAYLWNEAGTSWVSFTDAASGRMTPPTRLGVQLEGEIQAPASWHPDGDRLAVHDVHHIAIVDASSGKVLKTTEHEEVLSVGYIDHGNRIVTGKDSGTYYFDPDMDPQGATAEFVPDCCTASSPDGETAVLFQDGRNGATMPWRIVRAANGKVVLQGELPTTVNAAAYSPDGRLIAATGSGGVFTIDVRSGAVKVAPTIGHRSEGMSIRFSPDGTRLVSGAADGTVTLWNSQTLDSLLTVTTATDANPIAVAPIFADGSDVVTIPAYDGKTYRWNTATAEILAEACAMAGRNLTAAEWTQNFPDRAYQKTCP